MTQPRVMTSEEKRVAVAECLGFKRVKSQNADFDHVWKRGDSHWYALPNWPEDLNACAEMRRSMRPEEANKWVNQLEKIVIFGANPHWCRQFHIANAKGSEQVDAFLQVKGIMNERGERISCE